MAAFVADARARGLATEELRARTRGSGASYATGLRGWALRRDRSAAVAEDGSFYLLTLPGLGVLEALAALLRGVRLEPADPPLVMGRGGRDGESVPLADLLSARLEGPAS